MNTSELTERLFAALIDKDPRHWENIISRHFLDALAARIAELEAALRPFSLRIDEIEQVKAVAKFAVEGTAAVKLELLRRARAALPSATEETSR